MHLRFDPHSQRLRLIEVYDLSRMQVSLSAPAMHIHSRSTSCSEPSSLPQLHLGRSVSRGVLVLCHASLEKEGGSRVRADSGLREKPARKVVSSAIILWWGMRVAP